ncbi:MULTISPECIES: response regulator [unclassified Paenibacillus]|uniref:response regulator n=1 Tax=unclassified Paenibacillus TaxID=185978 RepID=UPI000956882A|nr:MULTISPECIES: response regulator [unclassified Paenibacillus]ASS67083.1 response regulator [Paenibacillus sp. RUD330]SIQ90682.1 two-component system, CitB family, response regulator DctR [Paenibacillus sp. RU4X]SIR11553.1 two-component system, CitB family, response regulator DctR [Paenibacillus sp. RU4T]
MKTVEVILIEDDPMVREVNRQFVESAEGFRVVGTASGGREGMELIRRMNPDLVILDIYMPGLDGIQTLRQLRSEGHAAGVIVISAANDRDTIRSMVQGGADDYIMKPFKAERVREALLRWRQRSEQLADGGELDQGELDRFLHGAGLSASAAPPSGSGGSLPKGLQAATLAQILRYLGLQPEAVSAESVAENVGIARVTARRYLEHLAKSGQVTLQLQYGLGRPVNLYSLNKT